MHFRIQESELAGSLGLHTCPPHRSAPQEIRGTAYVPAHGHLQRVDQSLSADPYHSTATSTACEHHEGGRIPNASNKLGMRSQGAAEQGSKDQVEGGMNNTRRAYAPSFLR